MAERKACHARSDTAHPWVHLWAWAVVASGVLLGTPSIAQQPGPATALQILGQQCAQLLTGNAELLAELNKARAETADLKAKCGDRCEPPKPIGPAPPKPIGPATAPPQSEH